MTFFMQPVRRLMHNLVSLASADHYLFAPDDLRALVPDISNGAFKTLLSRAVQAGYLARVCRGLYLYVQVMPSSGLLLFHAAARLRADGFNYLSLETVLSDAGVISQVPVNWISVMSSGRSTALACGRWGTIEFVHTRQRPEELAPQLSYDSRCRLWRASVPQALRDMRATHRNLALVDRSVAHEFV